MPEVAQHWPSAAILLVGTKVDLREDTETINRLRQYGTEPISYDQGVALARQVGAVAYLETSALTGYQVTDLPKRIVQCCIMNNVMNTVKVKVDKKCIIS